MDANDRAAIADLFSRLAEAEQRLPQRDPEAEALIRSEVARHPAAPYYMAQVIVAQQQALETAGRRIEALEQRGGGLFDGLFGGGQRAETPRARRPDGPWENRGGAGFLSGAAQTAMGVAGGVLLANVIGGALFGDGATAAEPPPDAPEAPEADGGDFDFDVGF